MVLAHSEPICFGSFDVAADTKAALPRTKGWGKAWGAPRAKAALPQCEQVSRGLELLSILREQPQQSDLDFCDSARNSDEEDDEVDVEVIVKGTFIEVVDPQLRRKMNRSLSDSALLDSVSERQQPWQKISSDKWTIDFSDASTTISKDAEDCQSSGSDSQGCVRKDTCWSDYGDDEMMMQSYMQYGMQQDSDGLWWMPMQYEQYEYDPTATVLCAMPDGSMCPMAVEWMEQGAVDCEGVEVLDDSADQEWRTTVMLRNMPNNYTRDMLLELVDSMGFSSCYDFAYLPVDFKSQAGLGYAFINFISSAEAQRCFETFEGYSGWKVPSEKVCTVTWGSPYQGLEAHIERYQNSPVMHHSIPDEWKPVLIEQGVRIVFPMPTKPIKTPKVRQPPAGQ